MADLWFSRMLTRDARRLFARVFEGRLKTSLLAADSGTGDGQEGGGVYSRGSSMQPHPDIAPGCQFGYQKLKGIIRGTQLVMNCVPAGP